MNVSHTFLPNWLTRCAEHFPQRLAVKCGEIGWSFAELDQRATDLARQLATLGISEGNRVALLASNGLPYVLAVHALMRLGAILIPLNIRLTIEELRWQITNIHASHLLSDLSQQAMATDLAQAIPEIVHMSIKHETNNQVASGAMNCVDAINLVPMNTPNQLGQLLASPLIDLDATQAIMYTSGTTGKPKGVIITYGMHWWNAIGSALNLGLREDDRWLACLPLFHIGGLAILLRSVIYGNSVILHERFDATQVNKSIFEDQVTMISLVAVMLERMLADLDAQNYPSTLRCILLGGGPIPRRLLEDCAERALPIIPTYGLTEACSQVATLSPTDALYKLSSVGRPLPQVQQRIMNGDQPAAAGEAGTIYLKGPSITPGYADDPEATAAAIQDDWFCTGDVGYLDAEGCLYILDRRSDLIISGGENIYPAEIESLLLAHSDVAEAGVCGQSDAQWGQVPIAFVCPHGDRPIDLQALQAYLAAHLARYKLPKAIHVVDHLPRNASGKLMRHRLAELADTSW